MDIDSIRELLKDEAKDDHIIEFMGVNIKSFDKEMLIDLVSFTNAHPPVKI